jgi:hypothetical protein
MIPGGMRAYVQQVGIRQRENAREALIATAHAEERRVIQQQSARSGGIAPTLTRIVDGRRGAAYETVRENGFIILQWGYMREIATVALARLRARAPERSGEYKAGIKLFVGASEAALSAGGIPASTSVFTVVATAPYSRRLEIGKSKDGGPFVVQVAPHIVAETAQFLAQDYRGVARVRFVFEDVEGPAAGAARSAAVRSSRRSERREARRAAVAVRFPGIRVTDDR